MNRHLIATFAVALLLSATGAAQHSPYAAEPPREIKALSDDEVRDYLDGKGMGLARAAELNGYPGPMHVLELGRQLELTPDQRRKTESLRDAMRARAIVAGRELVDAERELDALFRSRQANSAALMQITERIGAVQADLRRIHLDAHIAQAAILTPPQVDRYAALRGYTNAHGVDHQHRRH